MKEYLIGNIKDLPDGKGAAYKVGRATIAVFRSGGEVRAISNRCIHRGASMCEGELINDGRTVRCPWHNWPFELETGEHSLDPAEKLRTYRVRLSDGLVFVTA
jgi:nitrite reductase/ring-hydroxylating ferredoxin subunit